MTHQRLKIGEAKQLLDEFDRQWPGLKQLRDTEEHVLGPFMNAPAGIHYLGKSVAYLQPGGGVEYIVRAEDMEAAISKLHQDLCQLFEVELDRG